MLSLALLAVLGSVRSLCTFVNATSDNDSLQLEFVRQLSTNPENTVFAIVRTKNNSQSLTDMKAKNVHIIEANITDFKALKVSQRLVWRRFTAE